MESSPTFNYGWDIIQQFTVTAIYNYLDKEVSEQTTIDLGTYHNTNLPPQEALVTQLKEIAKAIKDLNHS